MSEYVIPLQNTSFGNDCCRHFNRSKGTCEIAEAASPHGTAYIEIAGSYNVRERDLTEYHRKRFLYYLSARPDLSKPEKQKLFSFLRPLVLLCGPDVPVNDLIARQRACDYYNK